MDDRNGRSHMAALPNIIALVLVTFILPACCLAHYAAHCAYIHSSEQLPTLSDLGGTVYRFLDHLRIECMSLKNFSAFGKELINTQKNCTKPRGLRKYRSGIKVFKNA